MNGTDFQFQSDANSTFTAATPPAITTDPTSVTIIAGDNATFNSAATGDPAPTEQWQVSTDGGATFSNLSDMGVYSGSTTATLSITGGTAAMNGYEYRDVFTNEAAPRPRTPRP